MNKPDYNSNFKMKISRSLTDLQNSLDEACRLGLPPHFETTMINHYDEINRDYNFKSDRTNNLERMITNTQQRVQYPQFVAPSSSKMLLSNDERASNNSVHLANHRETYLNVLRNLADDRRLNKMQQSQSQDALNCIHPRSNSNIGHVPMNNEVGREMRMLRQRLVEMDEEITRLRSVNSTRDEFQVGELCEELNKKLDIYRAREDALLNQLNEAVTTIEEAKYEEMQAVMQAERTKEELDNMERRFKEFVDDNARKMGNHSEVVDKEVQASIRHIKEELDCARDEMSVRLGECQNLREQLKNANLEIDRLNMSLKSVENNRYTNENSLEAAMARAVMHRDETIAHNQRLQGALDRERSERGSERSILAEEINDLRKRLTSAENNEVNLSQEKMSLMKESEEVKSDMAKMKQTLMSERRREHEGKESWQQEWEERVRLLSQELSRKEAYFEEVIGEASMVMRTQGAMIDRLKSELASTVEEMEGWAEKYREERDELRWRLSRATESVAEEQGRVKEVQEVVDEQGRVMATIRDKYGDLEATKTRQDEEIIKLMTARNTLLRTVEMLQAHLTEMRRRVPDCVCGVFDSAEQLINEKILEHIVMATV